MPSEVKIVPNDFDKLLEEINLKGFNSHYQSQIGSNPSFLENLEFKIEDKEIRIQSDDLLIRKLSFKINFDLETGNINKLNDLLKNVFGEEIVNFDLTNSSMENRTFCS